MAETAGQARTRRLKFDADWLRRNGVYVALALLIAADLAIVPNFASVATLRLNLLQVAPVVVVAMGMALVIGTGGIDLSVGSVMAIAAALIPLYIGYGTVPSILVALIAGVLTGLLAGTVVARVGVQPIVATLALLVAGRGIANLIGGRIQTVRDPGFRELGSGSIVGVPYVVLVAALVALAVWLFVGRTTTGRQLVAIGGNARASALAGIPVKRVLTTVYVVSGVLAAVAGVLVTARLQASDPTRVGQLYELSAITAVVVGGSALSGGQVRVLGTVAGAVLIQLITFTLVARNVADEWAQIVQAAIVILAVYVQLGRRPT